MGRTRLFCVLCFNDDKTGFNRVIRTHKELIACHDCGHVYNLPDVAAGEQLECVHCGNVIMTRHRNWESKVAALTATGLVLFVVANSFPFLGLEQAGQIQSSNLISGVQALLGREEFILAALVFITIFLFPLLELMGLAYLLIFRYAGVRAPFLGQVLHLLHISRPWSMLEIFLIGVLVSSIKLAGMALLIPGPGLYAFLGLVLVLISCHLFLDREEIWDWLDPDNYYANDLGEHLNACRCCDALIGDSLLELDSQCPRCGTSVHRRWPSSVQKTWALLIAAALLYIPSNILPIMRTTNLGYTVEDTIFSGVLHLAEAGDLPIALLIFIASIVIPLAKLIVMAYLLLSVSHLGTREPRQLAIMFRVTEFVGRWSMIDVFVVSILVALVQFGLLANVEPGAALLCFAGVVVLTMLAAETFDSKLIWDAYASSKESYAASSEVA